MYICAYVYIEAFPISSDEELDFQSQKSPPPRAAAAEGTAALLGPRAGTSLPRPEIMVVIIVIVIIVFVYIIIDSSSSSSMFYVCFAPRPPRRDIAPKASQLRVGLRQTL